MFQDQDEICGCAEHIKAEATKDVRAHVKYVWWGFNQKSRTICAQLRNIQVKTEKQMKQRVFKGLVLIQAILQNRDRNKS